jgi:predicted DNA-binding ribbon-helix-helix protein
VSLIQEDIKRTSKLLAIRIDGERTTVRLFDSEIKALNRICQETSTSMNEFCSAAAQDPRRQEHTLTGKLRGAIISFLLDQWKPV